MSPTRFVFSAAKVVGTQLAADKARTAAELFLRNWRRFTIPAFQRRLMLSRGLRWWAKRASIRPNPNINKKEYYETSHVARFFSSGHCWSAIYQPSHGRRQGHGSRQSRSIQGCAQDGRNDEELDG